MFRQIAMVLVVLSPLVSSAADTKDASRPNPKNAAIYNGMAWVMATSPNTKDRNGKHAVDYATKACELTGWKNPKYLATLAAAHAESGDYSSAIQCQERALALVPAGKTQEYTKRIELYQTDKPFRDGPKRQSR